MEATKFPTADTALYNHPLPTIEAWLKAQGCERDSGSAHTWHVKRDQWRAEIELDVDQLIVCYRYANGNGQDLYRSFKYALSRKDIEDAVFAGP
jgi:hypothetical protein